MTFPLFNPADDPGPSFAELLRRSGQAPSFSVDGGAGHGAHTPGLGGDPAASRSTAFGASGGQSPPTSHGTTVVAIRYADGVIMAGDRRATSGHLISHRTMEKVFAADRFSGVAIAGAAGPAVEMVRLFQLQLEHYEKVEGAHLSLEGKANQLGQMVRNHLPAAMQGLAVVPLFAGFDIRRGVGRLFQYDVTGGRYEEQDFSSTGSGSLHAGTVVKLGYRQGMNREEAIDLAIRALFQAADEDSATGGPDLVRGIYPTIATITNEGFTPVGQDEIERRFRAMLDDMATPDSQASATVNPGMTNGGDAR